ncbi:Uncharacterised protein [Leclercia adecarboxylata]|nr:Uncharacterised protein [Leclercia adecarboxylata]
MQYGVTGTMTKEIVNRLKLIEIEAKHCQRVLLRGLRLQLALQKLAHAHPVGQPGQFVVAGEILHACLGLHLQRDIRGSAPVAGYPLRCDDRFDRNMAVALMSHCGKIAAVQQAAMPCLPGQGNPVCQRLVFCGH